MRQKYRISLDPQIDAMTIEEYAVVDKDAYRKDNYHLTDADYVLLSEQTYPASIIKEAVARGREDIITELRTDQFFPAQLCSEKLADTVIELFTGENDQSIALLYDDLEVLAGEADNVEMRDGAESAKAVI